MSNVDVIFRPQVKHDLKRIGPGPERRRIRDALEQLRRNDPSLDIVALVGASPWRRLRVGDHRVLYREGPRHGDRPASWVVARIVHRRDLDSAVGSLPAE